MVILQLILTHFGKLEDRKLDLRTGMNVITGGNESGKTTIAAFIKAMLFGLSEEDEDYTLFYPRTYHGAFGGKMKVLQNGAFYEISRDFAKDKAFLKITKTSDGSEVTDPESWLNNALSGISKEEYENSAFISQKAVTSDQLKWGIPREKTSEEKAEETAAEEYRSALQKIREKKSEFEKESDPDITSRYEAMGSTIANLKKDLETVTESRNKKQETVNRAKASYEENIRSTDELNAEKENELKEKMLAYKHSLEEVELLKKNELEKKNIWGTVLITLSFLLALGTYFCMASNLWSSPEQEQFIYVIAGFGVAVLLFLVGLIVTILFAIKRSRTTAALSAQAAERASANEAEKEYQYYIEHKEELKAKVEDQETKKRVLEVMEEELKVMNDSVEQASNTLKKAEDDYSKMMPSALHQEEVVREIKSLEATEKSFTDLIDSFDKTHKDNLAEKASGYAAKLNTAGILRIDSVKDKVSVSVDKTQVPLTALSSSTMLETDLAVRLARLDHLDPQKGITIVLDDMFITLDNSHMTTAMGVLRSLGRQVILFSSQNRERTAL